MPPSARKSLSSQRVVVTGAGILTSMGNGWAVNSDGFRSGRTAFRKITVFDTSRQRVHHGGELDLPDSLPQNHSLTNRQVARLDRASAMLIHAAHEAWNQAGWTDQERSDSIPISLGTSAGAMACGEAFYRHTKEHPNSKRGQASRILTYQTHRQARHLADSLGISGPVEIISNACASGANAIGHAYQLIRRGETDRALAGGYDALAHLVFAGFDSLKALTTELPPRPFDANRSGLAIGEGAAMLTLESLESARARGAEIFAEIVGYGTSTDSHHLTQPHPEGDAALRSMQAASAEAHINPTDVDYLNSHGTGTPLNDIAEGRAIQRWAGTKNDQISVSSTKAGIGHLLGGAGAVETVIATMAMRENFLPPTATIETPDAVCTFDLVREPREKKIETVLTNSFGFGGANATLILKAFDEENKSRISKPDRSPTATPIRISGFGAVSPIGWSARDLVEKTISPALDTSGPNIKIQRVPPLDNTATFARHPRLRRASALSKFCASAALEALGETNIERVKSGEKRLGVIYALVNGCVNYTARFYGEVLENPEFASPILFPETVFNAPASHVNALLGAHDISYTILGDSTIFITGLQTAARWLEDNLVDLALVVGGEEYDPLTANAWELFSKNTIFAEGAGALLLEKSDQSAKGMILDTIFVSDLYANKTIKQGLIDDQTGSDRKTCEGIGASIPWKCVEAVAHGTGANVKAVGENMQTAGVTIVSK